LPIKGKINEWEAGSGREKYYSTGIEINHILQKKNVVKTKLEITKKVVLKIKIRLSYN